MLVSRQSARSSLQSRNCRSIAKRDAFYLFYYLLCDQYNYSNSANIIPKFTPTTHRQRSFQPGAQEQGSPSRDAWSETGRGKRDPGRGSNHGGDDSGDVLSATAVLLPRLRETLSEKWNPSAYLSDLVWDDETAESPLLHLFMSPSESAATGTKTAQCESTRSVSCGTNDTRVYLSADQVGCRHELRAHSRTALGGLALGETDQYGNPLWACGGSGNSDGW